MVDHFPSKIVAACRPALRHQFVMDLAQTWDENETNLEDHILPMSNWMLVQLVKLHAGRNKAKITTTVQ